MTSAADERALDSSRVPLPNVDESVNAGSTRELDERADERPGRHRPRRRLRRILALAAVLALAGGVTAGVMQARGGAGTPEASSPGNAATTSLASVDRRDLAAQTQVDGVLQHADSYDVVNNARGTITWLPKIGAVVGRGGVFYKVNGDPVILLYGSTPAYRTLAEGASADDVTGADVRELNANLVALGYATKSQLDPNSDEFGWRTKWALKKLQKHLGLDQTGVLALGQAVFLPGAARVVTAPATLGGTAQPGATVLTATSTTRNVGVDLDVSLLTHVKVGDKVTVTLPDGTTTSGTVTTVGSVATTPSDGAAGSSQTATVPVTISLADPSKAGNLDQAPVLVAITTASVQDVLVVPVNALLALAGGGYAVEVVAADGDHTLVPVSLGLFDDADGLVQVTGDGLAVGRHVVVPSG